MPSGCARLRQKRYHNKSSHRQCHAEFPAKVFGHGSVLGQRVGDALDLQVVAWVKEHSGLCAARLQGHRDRSSPGCSSRAWDGKVRALSCVTSFDILCQAFRQQRQCPAGT
jgi:hypothetical protein